MTTAETPEIMRAQINKKGLTDNGNDDDKVICFSV